MNVDGKEDKIGGTDCDAMYKDKKKIFVSYKTRSFLTLIVWYTIKTLGCIHGIAKCEYEYIKNGFTEST